MAFSLISYFCLMVTACAIMMVALAQLPSPPKFREPHPVVTFVYGHKAVEVELHRPRGAWSLSAIQSSANATKTAFREP